MYSLGYKCFYFTFSKPKCAYFSPISDTKKEYSHTYDVYTLFDFQQACYLTPNSAMPIASPAVTIRSAHSFT